MANVKISELPVATSLSNGDSFPVVQGGVTKQAARSVLFASPTFTGTTTADLLTATGDVTFDGGAFVFNESGADKDARFEGDTDANLLFLDASTDRIGVGTATPSSKLEVRNDVLATTSLDATAIKLYNNFDGGSGIEFSNDVGGKSKISFGVESSGGGTDDTYISFSTCLNAGALTERMRLDSSGNLIYRVNGTAPTLSTNSTMSFELTSNTSLKIVVRGTDGTTRSVSLTLA